MKSTMIVVRKRVLILQPVRPLVALDPVPLCNRCREEFIAGSVAVRCPICSVPV